MSTRSRLALALGAVAVVVTVAAAVTLTGRECGQEAITDVSREPNYVGTDLHRWTTADGCPVRLDVLMMREGPAHCGWSKAKDILMGTPLGAPHEREPRIYVRDPDNVIGDARTADAFDADAELPPAASDSGYRLDDVALWTSPDPAAVYLVSPSGVERWPLDESPAGCA